MAKVRHSCMYQWKWEQQEPYYPAGGGVKQDSLFVSDTTTLKVHGLCDPAGPLGLAPNLANLPVCQETCMETFLTTFFVTRKLNTARIVIISGIYKL